MNDEGLNLEYKREYVDDIKKTVVAFANTQGGKIIIGVEEDGNIVGLKSPDDTMLKVTNAIRDSIVPDITLFTVCVKEQIEDKTVISLTVQRGTNSPYYLAGKGIRPAGVYIRQGAASVPATEAAILKMIRETAGENYEEIRAFIQELTFHTLKQEFKDASILLEEAQMKTLHLVGSDGLYCNLGQMLSEQCIHTIKLAVFEGTTKEIFKDRYEFQGSLLRQLRECYSLIDRYNRTGSEFKGLERIDIRDYPITTIREALLNSIVHRDYSYSDSTLISIFDDRIEFVNIGGLVKGISKEDMLLGVSMLRNRGLGDIFYRLKLIEAFGTGIPKIMENYRWYERQPKIEITDNVFKITLYNTQYVGKTEKYIEKQNISYTEGEIRVLNIFENNKTIQRKDVEGYLSISQPMAVKYLKSLLDKNAIVRIGSGKNVRYRLN